MMLEPEFIEIAAGKRDTSFSDSPRSLQQFIERNIVGQKRDWRSCACVNIATTKDTSAKRKLSVRYFGDHIDPS